MLSSLLDSAYEWLRQKSLRWQLVGLCVSGAGAVVLACTATFAVVNLQNLVGADVQLAHTRLLTLLILVTAGVGIAVTLLIGRLLRPLHQMRQSMLHLMNGQYDVQARYAPYSRDLMHLDETFRQMVGRVRDAQAGAEESKRVLADRTQTVDRLLEFSQTIQGAGRPAQVFESLSFFLKAELGLAGLMVLSVEPGATPATQVKACFPTDLSVADRMVSDIDSTVCPCLRQNLPKLFACALSPIRCAIDNALALSPAHPAYCIPFNLRTGQCVAHMLLPVGQEWTGERRQLAQTYINTAHSTLVSLHLLAEAEKQSMTDVLTGLYNRRSMESLLEREVALAERHGHTLSIVMIDMDKFKEVNDSHGHAAGDYMLKSFADCVRMTLRKTDLAFRYGGDEFCIALPQTPIGQAQQVVQKLRQAYMAVDFSDAIANLDHQPTLSIGVAERAKPTVLTLQALLGAADAALYDAKNNNRNCIKLYEPPKAA